MPTYKLIVFTDPVAGREAEYNDWYDNVHLADVLKVAGVKAAQRLKLRTTVAGSFNNRYLAIYEFETDDPDAVMNAINSRSGTEAMPLSEALDMDAYNVAIFETLSD